MSTPAGREVATGSFERADQTDRLRDIVESQRAAEAAGAVQR